MKDSDVRTDPSPARPIRGTPEPTRRGTGLSLHGGPWLVTVLGGLLVILVLAVPSVQGASFAKHEDASGHAHHLTEKGDPANRDSATAKYEEGYDLDGTGDYLYNDDDTMDHWGAAAWVVVFETDDLSSHRILYHVRQDGGSGQYVRIIHRISGKIKYADTGGDQFISSGTVPTGEVLGLWLRRTDNGDGTFDLRVKVFNVAGDVLLNETEAGLTLPTGLDGSAEMAVGAKADGANPHDGGVYEVRDWKATIPSDATLDQVADPSATGSANFEETAEGTEEGLWFLEPVTIGNAAPTADFTHSCTHLDCDFTDQSTDSDGSIASWSWDFGDGNTSTVQHPSHSYACGGTYTVTLTVTDDDGASNSTSKDVPVSDVDTDGDGLTDCVEEAGGTNACGDPWSPTRPLQNDSDTDGLEDGPEVNTHCTEPTDQDTDNDGLVDEEGFLYGTDPLDPDTDDDEFDDGEEVNRFGLADPADVFCGSAGCAYPDPTTKDIYFEIDGIEDCHLLCETHMISNDERDQVVAAFENVAGDPINAYFDTGQYASTGAHGGQLIDDDNLDETVDWEYLVLNIEDNNTSFDPRRAGIFHHMIAVHDLTVDGERYCGFAQVDPQLFLDNRADFSALAHGDITNPFSGCNDGDASLSVVTTTLEEFGHNFFGNIDYQNDQCGNDTTHDEFGHYSIDGDDCDPHDTEPTYYHPQGPSHRWWEAKNHVSNSPVEGECTDQDVLDDDHLACPSPGDLNNGLAGKDP